MVFRQFAFAAIFFFPVVLPAQDTVITAVPAPPDTTAKARDTTAKEAPHHVMVGSDDENYLRYLQDAGLASLYPWSLREFSQKELAAMAVKPGSHPWSGKGDYKDYPSRYSFKILPVNVVFRFNSAFPYGSNDGAVWAGRGLTSAIDLGFAFRAGPLSATFNPVAFRAENRAFELQANGVPSNPYADGLFGIVIDRPQRFGSGAYARVDPGETTVRLDLVGLTAGVSTANMGWGPMELYPYIIGGNAPGFPHAFAGTSSPLPIWIGKIHGRVYWGRLEQSTYSPVTGTSYYSSMLESGTKRFMSGAVGIFEPRGVPGLELGVARFFHSVWPRTGIPRSYLTKAFQAILKNSLGSAGGFAGGADPGIEDNQLASAFARWAFPSSGFEVYGEYGREDHSANFRDFIQEPDHSRTYGLGLRKIFRSDSLQLSALRVEIINYEFPTLARHRQEGGIYIHGLLHQGHTNRGQLLGSDAGVGSGGGSVIAWDTYDRRGSRSIIWTRTIREQNGNFHVTGVTDSRSNDVQNALTFAHGRNFGHSEITAGVTLVREFNRDLRADAWNMNIVVGFRLGISRGGGRLVPSD
jgi:hypothetical protein